MLGYPRSRHKSIALRSLCDSQNMTMDLWRERGYPNINWDGFEERVQSYFPQIEKLLVPGVSSLSPSLILTREFLAFPGTKEVLRMFR
jgi:hypothetical protein